MVGPELRALWEKNYAVYGRRKLWKAAQRRDMGAGLRLELDLGCPYRQHFRA